MEEANRRIEELIKEVKTYNKHKKDLEDEINKMRGRIEDQRGIIAQRDKIIYSLTKKLKSNELLMKSKEKEFRRLERSMKSVIKRRENVNERLLGGNKFKAEGVLRNQIKSLENSICVLEKFIVYLGEHIGFDSTLLFRISEVVDGFDDPVIQRLVKNIKNRNKESKNIVEALVGIDTENNEFLYK
jgi:predicted RNase H-like nuclease (RuvC/YqgF family)